MSNFFTPLFEIADHPQAEMSYELLVKIATLRFICVHITKWSIECFDLLNTGLEPQTSEIILAERRALIARFKRICLMEGHNDVRVFLFKNIYHQLGSDTINILRSNNKCSWILPDCAVENGKVIVNELRTSFELKKSRSLS